MKYLVQQLVYNSTGCFTLDVLIFSHLKFLKLQNKILFELKKISFLSKVELHLQLQTIKNYFILLQNQSPKMGLQVVFAH